jgi:hypothetical protein
MLWKPQIFPDTTAIKHFDSIVEGNYFYCSIHNSAIPLCNALSIVTSNGVEHLFVSNQSQ